MVLYRWRTISGRQDERMRETAMTGPRDSSRPHGICCSAAQNLEPYSTEGPLAKCPGYRASNVQTSATGLVADLKLAGAACNTRRGPISRTSVWKSRTRPIRGQWRARMP
ncbi:hypothetical protein BT67DRAFT_166576 [Trichocladium antarcticum]|uniref:Uncharacterized protein n=1 Tax=Trichocladium antarcticum TaxID=1450529 RepID=A0AAN6UDV6_9PEZI|nr:hypothetical protein BT67DRAFT_166576 [Trichocladium antarcticum]